MNHEEGPGHTLVNPGTTQGRERHSERRSQPARKREARREEKREARKAVKPKDADSLIVTKKEKLDTQ